MRFGGDEMAYINLFLILLLVAFIIDIWKILNTVINLIEIIYLLNGKNATAA